MSASAAPAPTVVGPDELFAPQSWDPPEVQQAKEVLRQAVQCRFISLTPLLPLVLNLKGKPYTLKNHAPFEPLFSTIRAPVLTLKSGRQCGKSASLRAEGILAHLSRPYLSTLYVTPLFEMIRRFSSDMSLLIEESPLRHLMKVKDSVLHKVFANKSQMYFSFAFLDATRCRGVPAGRNVIDECFRGTGLLETPTGHLLIRDARPGDVVKAFDDRGRVLWVHIRKQWYAGKRRCYRLLLEDGRYLDVTADHRVATNAGCLRVSEIVEAVQARCEAPEGVPLAQAHHIARVRLRETVALEEEQTRQAVGQILDCVGSGISLLAEDLAPQRSQAGGGLVADRPSRVRQARRRVDRRRRHSVRALRAPRYWAERHGDLYVLRESVTAEAVGSPDRLADLPVLRVGGVSAHLCAHAEEGVRQLASGRTTVSPVPLAKVIDLGLHDTYEIEAADPHTLIVNGVCALQCQDLDPEHLPVIHETMSAEPDPQILYAGTPKTMEGTLQGLWVDSSQAEWVIKCRACNYWNIPSLAHDLDKMIGSNWEEASEEKPGVVCARCGRPINPREGHFEHARPELRFEHAGYHIPQIIMPFHYANPRKWKLLLHKRAGGSNYTPAKFYNEVLGESFDSGAKLVSQTDIKRACTLPWANTIEEALQHYNPDNYVMRVLGVDWGAGGEKEVSFTTMAVCGLTPAGQIHVIYGEKSLTPTAHMEEANRCITLMQQFRCTHIAHDYTGAGALRETFMTQRGLNHRQLIPIAYVRAASGNLMRFVPATDIHPRDHYRVDKSRSLTTLAAAIKTGNVRFFQYDWKSREEPGLLNEFCALVEDKVQSRTAGDIYTVIRHPHLSDDFAHSVNLASCSMWYTTRKWPQFTAR